MGRSIDGYLILGWEVECSDCECMYDEDGEYIGDWEENDDVAKKVRDAFKAIGMDDSYSNGPTWVYSLYYDNDYMWVGVRIAYENDMENYEDIHAFVRRIDSRANDYEKAAYAIYEAIVGSPAKDSPCVMSIGCEG